MLEKYYEVLDTEGEPYRGSNGQWLLPVGDQPGEWMPEVADIQSSGGGYHLNRRQDLVYGLGPTLWEAEGCGKMIARRMRLSFRVLDCFGGWRDGVNALPGYSRATARRRCCRFSLRIAPKTRGLRSALPWRDDTPSEKLLLRNCTQLPKRLSMRLTRRLAGVARAGCATFDRAALIAASGLEVAGLAANAAASAGVLGGHTAAHEAADKAKLAASAAAILATYAAAGAGVATAASVDEARMAASAATHTWQTDRLFEYLDGLRG